MKAFGPLNKVLVLGQGDLAKRQRPTYEHWLVQGVEVHCADTDPGRLKSSLPGLHTYVLPQAERAILARAPFDLLYVANTPALHLKTALKYGAYSKQIIIQKPLHSGVVTRAIVEELGDLRHKITVHDHYRNKGAFAALVSQRYQKQPRRLLFFLTETKSVTSETDRAGALACGVILDLGVHMFSLLLDCIRAFALGPRGFSPLGWESGLKPSGQDPSTYSGAGEFPRVELQNCFGAQEVGSNLGTGVETLAVLDITVERTAGPAPSLPSPTTKVPAKANVEAPNSENKPPLDVLIVVGKGVGGRSQDGGGQYSASGDLKTVVVEFADGEIAVADLSSQSVFGLPPADINAQHGGLNRPLLLISPNPPGHACYGLGGQGYPQWQSFTEAALACEIAHRAQKLLPQDLHTYNAGIVLEDYLGQLIRKGKLRPIWGDIGNPHRFKIPPSYGGFLYD